MRILLLHLFLSSVSSFLNSFSVFRSSCILSLHLSSSTTPPIDLIHDSLLCFVVFHAFNCYLNLTASNFPFRSFHWADFLQGFSRIFFIQQFREVCFPSIL